MVDHGGRVDMIEIMLMVDLVHIIMHGGHGEDDKGNMVEIKKMEVLMRHDHGQDIHKKRPSTADLTI